MPEDNPDYCLLNTTTYSYPKRKLKASFFRCVPKAGKYAFSIYDEDGNLLHHEYIEKSLNDASFWMDLVLTRLSKENKINN